MNDGAGQQAHEPDEADEAVAVEAAEDALEAGEELAEALDDLGEVTAEAAAVIDEAVEDLMPTINAMNSEMDLKKREKLQMEIAQYYHDNASAIFSHERVQVDGIASNLYNYTIINRTVPYHLLEFRN